MTRDIALQVADTVTNAEVMQIFQQHGGAYLKDVTLFDVYAGSHMAPGQRVWLIRSLIGAMTKH